MIALDLSANGFPIIDLGGLTTDPEKVSEVTRQLDQGLRSYNCVYLKGHGISKEVISDFFEKSAQFFSLPDDIKIRYEKGSRKGIDIDGYSRAVKESFRERYDFSGHCMGNDFPELEVPGWTASLEAFETRMRALGRYFLQRIESALGFPMETLTQRHLAAVCGDVTVPSKAHFSSIHYSNPGDSQEVGDLMMGKHTDLSTVTFLCSTTPGLQVQVPNCSDWFDAEPIDGTILVNVGEMLQALTNGEYKATVHRVKNFPSASAGRQSLVCFVHPDAHVLVTPVNKALGNVDDGEQISAGHYFERMMVIKNAPTPSISTLPAATSG